MPRVLTGMATWDWVVWRRDKEKQRQGQAHEPESLFFQEYVLFMLHLYKVCFDEDCSISMKYNVYDLLYLTNVQFSISSLVNSVLVYKCFQLLIK